MRFLQRPTMTYRQFVDLHSRPATRYWHCLCTLAGILASVLVFGFESSPWWHAAIWSCVYVLNSLSHPILEGNRPASTRSVRMFFRAVLFNFRMTWDTLRGAV